MKQLFAATILALVLGACAAPSAPNSALCQDGVCIEAGAVEPVRANQPIVITATITSDKDVSHVGVAFYSSYYDLLIENGSAWAHDTQGEWVDLKANQAKVVTHRVLLPKEGSFGVVTSAMGKAFRVEDVVHIVVTDNGGKVYLRGQTVPTEPSRRLEPLTPGGPTLPLLTPRGGPPATIPGRSYTPILPTAPPPTRRPALETPTLAPQTPTPKPYP